MFDYVSGKVAGVGENRVVIDFGGVGFLLTATAAACADCSRKSDARLPVYLAVREDALELFGFASEAEREMFMLLIGVSGVGPKLAVTVLSGLNLERIASAVATGDVALLSSVKGVGKKTAERIALELKGKIQGVALDGIVISDVAPIGSLDEKAVLALIGLGYDRKEAETEVKKAAAAKPNATTEELVFAVLHG